MDAAQPQLRVVATGENYCSPPLVYNPTGPWTADAPLVCRVTHARYLTAPSAVKRTGFIDVEIPKSVTFEPGDAFGIVCSNCEATVNSLLAVCAHDDLDAAFTFESPAGLTPPLPVPKHLGGRLSVRSALTHRCDLTALPSKALVKALAAFSSSHAQRMRDIAGPKGRDDWRREIEEPQPDVIDLIKKFEIKISIVQLIPLLPPLQPRFYSAANSVLAHPGHLHFAFTVFDIELPGGRRRQGVCSTQLSGYIGSHSASQDPLSLASLSLSDAPSLPAHSIALFPRATAANTFRLPADLSVPLILIGPGTGVAPFRGFLQHLQALRSKDPSLRIGPIWLFFGCRNAERDQLFREEMEAHVHSGLLTRYIVAYSRETDEVVYVQHRLAEHGAEVLPLMLTQRGHMYVCGDARAMAKAVLETLLTSLKASGLSDKEAMERRGAWMAEKRLLIDAW